MASVKLEPGMKVIIRSDIKNGSNGIPNASSYRNREMTISFVDGNGCKLDEDEQDWWWEDFQFQDVYYPGDCVDPHVDSSFDTMLSGF